MLTLLYCRLDYQPFLDVVNWRQSLAQKSASQVVVICRQQMLQRTANLLKLPKPLVYCELHAGFGKPFLFLRLTGGCVRTAFALASVGGGTFPIIRP